MLGADVEQTVERVYPTPPAEGIFLKLKTPLVLQRRVVDPKLKRGYREFRHRLEVGEVVIVYDLDDDPKNRAPFRCAILDWPDLFCVGRGHEVMRSWFVIDRNEKGKLTLTTVEKPEDVDVAVRSTEAEA